MEETKRSKKLSAKHLVQFIPGIKERAKELTGPDNVFRQFIDNEILEMYLYRKIRVLRENQENMETKACQ